jgi:hypothetical protein
MRLEQDRDPSQGAAVAWAESDACHSIARRTKGNSRSNEAKATSAASRFLLSSIE